MIRHCHVLAVTASFGSGSDSPVYRENRHCWRPWLKEWWKNNKKDENVLTVDLSTDIEVLFNEYEEYEIREIFDVVFRYLYTKEVDMDIVDFEEWMSLVRVADYFAMDSFLQIYLTFKILTILWIVFYI